MRRLLLLVGSRHHLDADDVVLVRMSSCRRSLSLSSSINRSRRRRDQDQSCTATTKTMAEQDDDRNDGQQQWWGILASSLTGSKRELTAACLVTVNVQVLGLICRRMPMRWCFADLSILFGGSQLLVIFGWDPTFLVLSFLCVEVGRRSLRKIADGRKVAFSQSKSGSV